MGLSQSQGDYSFVSRFEIPTDFIDTETRWDGAADFFIRNELCFVVAMKVVFGD